MGDIKIKEAKNIEKLRISEFSNVDPLVISEVRHIAPAAVHIKELNHIDPISIESLRVNEVKNLDPIRIEKFNVTHLPTVNLSLRQLPPVDMNIRRIPPVSIGLHQDFCLPSNYTLRAQLLGIEFLRLHVAGHTVLSPRDKVRREQHRTPNRSFPEVAVAGNPAIPSRIEEKGARVMASRPSCSTGKSMVHSHPHSAGKGSQSYTGTRLEGAHIPTPPGQKNSGGLRVGGQPWQTFPARPSVGLSHESGSSVSGGEN
jgi:hypothetical protein